MRIVYLSSTNFADCDFPLVKELQNQGHTVYFFLDLPIYKLRSTLVDIKEQIHKDGIFKATVYREFKAYEDYMSFENVFVINRTEKSSSHYKNIFLYLKFASVVRKINPDVINVVGAIDLLSSVLLQFKRKIVLTVHDPFPHTGEKSFRRDFFRVIAMKFIPKFILLNENQKDDFVKSFSLNNNQVYLNRLGVYDCISKFVKHPCEHTKSNKVVLFFGRISPYKGLEYLLEAMKLVHEKVPDARLIIAGGGKFYFDISSYKQLPYVEFRNHYIGMDELAELIQSADIVVCPYTDATQSGVVMTAYSLCKPVVATDVGGMKETVISGKTGILVSPKDSIELAKALIYLLKNGEELKSMERFISEHFFEKYNWRKIANDYIDIYKS